MMAFDRCAIKRADSSQHFIVPPELHQCKVLISFLLQSDQTNPLSYAQDRHTGQQALQPPLFPIPIDRWLIDPLHELLNIVVQLFTELLHFPASHSEPLLAALVEAMRLIGVNLASKLERVTKSAGTSDHPNKVTCTIISN